MGMSLKEYSAIWGETEPETERKDIERAARSYKEKKQDREEAEQLKISMIRQLEKGEEPQYILYTAIKTIGILTQDKEWAAAGEKLLDSVYKDLAQQALFLDNETVAAERVEKRQAEYREKLKKQLENQLRANSRIERALQDALKAVDDAETEPEEILQ